MKVVRSTTDEFAIAGSAPGVSAARERARGVKRSTVTLGPGGGRGVSGGGGWARGRPERRCFRACAEEADRATLDPTGGAGHDQAAGGCRGATAPRRATTPFRATAITAYLAKGGTLRARPADRKGTRRPRPRSSTTERQTPLRRRASVAPRRYRLGGPAAPPFCDGLLKDGDRFDAD